MGGKQLTTALNILFPQATVPGAVCPGQYPALVGFVGVFTKNMRLMICGSVVSVREKGMDCQQEQAEHREEKGVGRATGQ